jgi:hypothetical protein
MIIRWILFKNNKPIEYFYTRLDALKTLKFIEPNVKHLKFMTYCVGDTIWEIKEFYEVKE